MTCTTPPSFFSTCCACRVIMVGAALGGLLLGASVPALGQQTYTSSVEFMNALAAAGLTPTIEGFETEPVGTVIPENGALNGLVFSNWPPALEGGLIADLFASFDFQNLAAERDFVPGQNPIRDFFFPGDQFTVTFPEPVNAVGIFFNIGAEPFADYVFVETPVGTASSGGPNPDTGTFFFAGIISPTPFDTANIGATFAAVTGFNLDNLIFATASSPSVPGDMNCDGRLDGGDIDPFFLALGDPAAYLLQFPNCDLLNGDMNGDGRLDGGDIDPFFACLGGGPCP